jgi:hypothetical protein
MINTIPGSGAKGVKKAETSSSLTTLPSNVRKDSASSANSKASKNAEDSGVIKDVALKIIPKKKVKGNEAAVWSEMDVLKGLDHENIVSASRTLANALPHTFHRSSFTSALNRGPSITSPSSLRQVENSSSGSARGESSRSPMRFLSCGKRRVRQHV